MICEDCIPRVKCQCYESCHKSTCMDCVNKDVGVKQCPHGGEAFCSDCKPVEYCFNIGGDVCADCHSKSHDIVECYWQLLPPKLRQILPDFAKEVSIGNLAKFWHECTKFIGSDKEFDLKIYREIRQARVSSFVLAVDFLLKDNGNEAVYMMFYSGLLEEIDERGPDYTATIFEKKSKLQRGTILSIFFDCFHSMIIHTVSREKIVAFLHKELLSIECGLKGIGRLEDMLSKVQTSICEIHDIESISDTVYKKAIKDVYGNSMRLKISISNMDTGKKTEWSVYKDMTLGWWLKVYVIKCNDNSWLGGPQITPSTKYFRAVHKGKTIFFSSSGKKTLHEIGIQDGDEITLGGVDLGESSKGDHSAKTSSTKTGANKSKKSKKSSGSKKKKKLMDFPTPLLTEDQIEKKHRQTHSRAISRVLEELNPLLKEIRNRLNDLTSHKSAPKVRNPSCRKRIQPQEVLTPMIDDYIGGKAGKIAYPILVGEVSNLYKTSKSSNRSMFIDLHGLPKDEAVEKLDESLSVWVDTAMRGEYPWVIPVDIVCGGGSQILSGAVKDWIRRNCQVANRPKNFS